MTGATIQFLETRYNESGAYLNAQAQHINANGISSMGIQSFVLQKHKSRTPTANNGQQATGNRIPYK